MVLKIKHMHVSSSCKGQRVDIKPKKVIIGLVLLKLDFKSKCMFVTTTELKFFKSDEYTQVGKVDLLPHENRLVGLRRNKTRTACAGAQHQILSRQSNSMKEGKQRKVNRKTHDKNVSLPHLHC